VAWGGHKKHKEARKDSTTFRVALCFSWLQRPAVDIGEYYLTDAELAGKAMRSSATLNAALATLS
jgi:monomeric isocitrate dehydrogenase